MTSLLQSLVEKAAFDNGWEIVEDRRVFRSGRHPGALVATDLGRAMQLEFVGTPEDLLVGDLRSGDNADIVRGDDVGGVGEAQRERLARLEVLRRHVRPEEHVDAGVVRLRASFAEVNAPDSVRLLLQTTAGAQIGPLTAFFLARESDLG